MRLIDAMPAELHDHILITLQGEDVTNLCWGDEGAGLAGLFGEAVVSLTPEPHGSQVYEAWLDLCAQYAGGVRLYTRCDAQGAQV